MCKKQRPTTKAMTLKVVVGSVMAALSLGASAGVVLDSVTGGPIAGSTRPTNAAGDLVDGTVFFAVFENEGAVSRAYCGSAATTTFCDPWGTGYNVVDAAQRGVDARQASPTLSIPIKTDAKYLYVYQTWNSRNTGAGTMEGGVNATPRNTNPITGNDVTLNPDLVSSWGALQLNTHTGGSTRGTYIDFVTDGDCPLPGGLATPGNVGSAQLCDPGTDVKIAADPNVGAFTLPAPDYEYGINGLPTSSTVHLLRSSFFDGFGFTIEASVDLTAAALVANYVAPSGGGSGPLYGRTCVDDTTGALTNPTGLPDSATCPTGSTLVDLLQFGTVFFATSDEPWGYHNTSLQGGDIASGLVPTPGRVPEPAMLALLGVGFLLLGWSRKASKV